MADLTLIAGNPAHRLQEQYQDLMNTHCVDTLKQKALGIVAQGGISPKNAAKFKAVVTKETSLPRLQSYLTNFVLAGAGLAVGAGRR